MGETGDLFERLFRLNEKLRGPGGCPWDGKQTILSLRECLESESAKVLSAIDAGDMENLCEECGDLLYNILFIASIAQEKGEFTINDVLRRQYEKIISRHPYVFGSVMADSPEHAHELYLKAKREGKK
ncbi:MAG TPA: nucleotide pyrophosphohydrolase [Candidatus Altiarchaeales archaeon]|nr:nucleotide pyrophosphohydrolase [Candidatus Altiarchaeales archaeon]